MSIYHCNSLGRTGKKVKNKTIRAGKPVKARSERPTSLGVLSWCILTAVFRSRHDPQPYHKILWPNCEKQHVFNIIRIFL